MLIENFYKMLSIIQGDDNSLKASLEIDKDHPVFQGHFPGFPVVPGVCMMQIIKELLEEKLGKNLQLVSAGSIKFLSLINPIENNLIDAEVKNIVPADRTFCADGIISANGTVYFKIIRAVYK